MIDDLAGVRSPFGTDVVLFETIDSTNEEVRRRAAHGAPAGLVVVADAQTAGRGRRGRAWDSPAGAGIYCSVLLRPGIGAREAVVLPLRAALAAWRALGGLGIRAVWKWPNDMYVGGRKVAGILVESSSSAQGVVDVAVVGVGINVSARDWPEELRGIATSLAEATGKTFERREVLERLLVEIARALCSQQEPPFP